MKKILFVLFLMVFVLSACGTTENSIPTTTDTPTSSPTETPIPPTATITPSPTPEPLGGGGTIFMGLNQLLVPEDMSLGNTFVWLSSSSDGSNLKPLGFEIYSISPNGKRMIVRKDEMITLIDPDGTNAVSLNTAENIFVGYTSGANDWFIIPYKQSVIWLSNGKVVFLASEKPDGKNSLYIVNLDGTDLIKLEQPSASVQERAMLLFESPDGSGFYWVTGTKCDTRGICDEKYYFSKMDDTDQQQVWQEIKNAGDNVFLSPSGLYIAYSAYFGNRDDKNGCYLATIEGEPISKMEKDELVFTCNRGNRWSPTEDKILGYGWEGSDEQPKKYYAIWSAPNGEVTRLPDYNGGDCYTAEWMPDGNQVFLSICVETWTYISTLENSLGQRMINVSDGTVTEFPDFGYCNYVLSPDTQWAFFYACENKKGSQSGGELIAYPSQLLNLKTKEAFPLFVEFVSDEEIDWREENWLSFWIP